ncbi:MAG TPA: nuclear transport factor 2 family protein [Terriglobales bacterium]|nr:nuclear transport factor 2 family protein [Terriglobales bacterium]
MKRMVFVAAISLIVSTACFATQSEEAHGVANKTLLQADQTFLQTLQKSNKAQADAVLNSDFTWTDSQGRTETKAQFLDDLSAPLTKAINTDLKAHSYGQVAVVTASNGRVHAVRIWVNENSAWKLLAYQETTLADKPTPPKNDSRDCENPCKTLPYIPKNDAEREIIASWQKLETAVTNHNAQGWAPHVANEFKLVNSNNDHVLTKSDRMAILDKQKQSGSPSAPVPLISAKMFDYGDTVVMKAEHQRATGKAIHVTRVWIKRDGKWIMAFSQQTTVQ